MEMKEIVHNSRLVHLVGNLVAVFGYSTPVVVLFQRAAFVSSLLEFGLSNVYLQSWEILPVSFLGLRVD